MLSFSLQHKLACHFRTYVFLWEYTRSISRPEIIRGDLGFSCFSLFWVIVFLCSICAVIFRCSKFSNLHLPKFIVYFWGCFSWFWFCLFSTSEEIGWEEHIRYDPFCVEWDVKPELNHSVKLACHVSEFWLCLLFYDCLVHLSHVVNREMNSSEFLKIIDFNCWNAFLC